MGVETRANANTPHPRWAELEKRRRMPRHFMEGADKIKERDLAVEYLPRNPAERPAVVPTVGVVDPWWNRVQRSRFYNVFKETVYDLAGRAFARTPKPKDMPAAMELFIDDVDGLGTNLQVFGLARAVQSTAKGLDFVLIDFPKPADPNERRTAEDDKRDRRQPLWKPYECGSVIDWEFVSGRLVMVRLREAVEVRNGFEVGSATQVRIIYAGSYPTLGTPLAYARYEIWKPRKHDEPEGEWYTEEDWGGTYEPQIDIPFVGFATDVVGAFDAVPPLSDLAHLNLAHYRKTSDLDNAQHAVGFPFLHWAGGELDANGQPVGLGPDRLAVSSDPNAKLDFVEVEGKAFAALQATIDAIEKEMSYLASQPVLQQQSGALTATGEAIRSARASSKLESWTLGWEDSIARCLYHTALYLGVVKPGAAKGWGRIDLNKRFVPTQRDSAVLSHREYLHKERIISDETIFEQAKLDEVLSPELKWDEEQGRVEAQGASDSDLTSILERAAQLDAIDEGGMQTPPPGTPPPGTPGTPPTPPQPPTVPAR